jgi:hypothetical protein
MNEDYLNLLSSLPGAARNCSQLRYGAGEAYQPLLEGLTRLCRQPGRERSIATESRVTAQAIHLTHTRELIA